MDLNSRVDVQLAELQDWLVAIAQAYETPPSKEVWAGVIVKGLMARADFLHRYSIPDVQALLNGQKLMEFQPSREVEPDLVQRSAPTFVGVAGADDPALELAR